MRGWSETCWEVSLLSSPQTKGQTNKAGSPFLRTDLKCADVCVCVSTVLLLKSTLPSSDGAARFVLLLNSRCHSRPPTWWETAKCPQSVPVVSCLPSACWRPSRPHAAYLSAPAVRRLPISVWRWPWCVYVCVSPIMPA